MNVFNTVLKRDFFFLANVTGAKDYNFTIFFTKITSLPDPALIKYIPLGKCSQGNFYKL